MSETQVQDGRAEVLPKHALQRNMLGRPMGGHVPVSTLLARHPGPDAGRRRGNS